MEGASGKIMQDKYLLKDRDAPVSIFLALQGKDQCLGEGLECNPVCEGLDSDPRSHLEAMLLPALGFKVFIPS